MAPSTFSKWIISSLFIIYYWVYYKKNEKKGSFKPKENCILTLPKAYAEWTDVRNRTEEGGRRQTLMCDKRDNNFVWKNLPPNFTFF